MLFRKSYMLLAQASFLDGSTELEANDLLSESLVDVLVLLDDSDSVEDLRVGGVDLCSAMLASWTCETSLCWSGYRRCR